MIIGHFSNNFRYAMLVRRDKRRFIYLYRYSMIIIYGKLVQLKEKCTLNFEDFSFARLVHRLSDG